MLDALDRNAVSRSCSPPRGRRQRDTSTETLAPGSAQRDIGHRAAHPKRVSSGASLAEGRQRRRNGASSATLFRARPSLASRAQVAEDGQTRTGVAAGAGALKGRQARYGDEQYHTAPRG
jgi:hypothetical protein